MLRVAEAAAFAAGEFIGRGKKDEADAAAVEAMRREFDRIDFSGRIVIGEGERDEAPMLFIGEEVGRGGEEIDIAVDPLEGTNLCAYAQPNSLALLAFAPRGSLLYAPDTYMWKVAAGPAAGHAISIDKSPTENIQAVADALGKPVSDVVVCILDRDRHRDMIAECHAAGARVRLIGDGDVYASVATAIAGTGIDLYMGAGGAPEGVLAAVAMKCVGGGFQGRFAFRSDEERARAAQTSGVDLDGVLTIDDLVRTEDAVFIATGVTDGEMLRGVRGGTRAHSVVMDCRDRTVRFVETIYRSQGDGLFTLS